MTSKILISLVAAAALALPGAVPASQPEVTLAALQPPAAVVPVAYELQLLLLDPYQHAEFGIVLPEGHTTFDAAVPAAPQS